MAHGYLQRPLGLILTLVLAQSASAFESAEHERLGNLAFHFALRVHCQSRPSAPECQDPNKTFSDPLGRQPQEGLTYGEVVRCVDYFLTPEKMIARREDNLFSPPKASTTPTSILPQTASEFSVGKHCDDSIFNFSATQAAHSNHAHFQAELVASQGMYHRLAISLGRENKLFAALFVNAISDHYLHDFFAPGHIGTFRSHMSDIYSNTLHDLINTQGANLRFQPADYDSLLRSLSQVSDNENLDLGEVQIDSNAKVALSCLPSRPALDRFMSGRHADICADRQVTPDHLSWLEGVDNLGQLLQSLKPRLGREGQPATLHVLGDNQLWRPAQRDQRVLMLALEIRSILDVLRAGQPRKDENWFADGTWSSARQNDAEGALIDTSIDGRFGFRMRYLPAGDRRDEIEAQAGPAADADVIGIAELHHHALRLKLQLMPPSPREIVLSVGFNSDMPRFGQAGSRPSISLETPVLAFLSLDDSKINSGVAAGVFRFNEGSRWGTGFSLRPGLVLSQSETFLSVPLRAFHYHNGNGSSVWRSSWGLRVDQGFSSFMTVFLQYSNSPYRQEPNLIGRGLVFGAGVVLAAPLCRVPKLGEWLC